MTTATSFGPIKDSRAEMQLGSAVIRMSANTGFSFLDLDDQTVQIQLTSGAINVTVRRLGEDDDFEVDTPNQAFTISQPGHYRVEASSDGNYTVISIREGEGEATGNGQDFRLHGGQRGTFSGTDHSMPKSTDLTIPMTSTIGPRTAIIATTIPVRRSICRTMWSAMRISMTTATGATMATTATSGFPTGLKLAGLLTTPATGRGFRPGAIRGSMTRPGVMLRSTTDAG